MHTIKCADYVQYSVIYVKNMCLVKDKHTPTLCFPFSYKKLIVLLKFRELHYYFF